MIVFYSIIWYLLTAWLGLHLGITLHSDFLLMMLYFMVSGLPPAFFIARNEVKKKRKFFYDFVLERRDRYIKDLEEQRDQLIESKKKIEHYPTLHTSGLLYELDTITYKTESKIIYRTEKIIKATEKVLQLIDEYLTDPKNKEITEM